MMPLKFDRTGIVLIFALAVGLFSGCSYKSTAVTKFYVLNPANYSEADVVKESWENPSLFVEISSLRLPQYLERPQIVTRSGENRLELAEYHQWGGNLRKNMVRALAKNLSRILSTPNIAIYSHRSPVPPNFRIDLEVTHFERDFGGKVRLSVQWRLSGGKDKKHLGTKITDLESPPVSTGSDFKDTVSAMSALLGELSKIIGDEIMKNSSGKTNR